MRKSYQGYLSIVGLAALLVMIGSNTVVSQIGTGDEQDPVGSFG